MKKTYEKPESEDMSLEKFREMMRRKIAAELHVHPEFQYITHLEELDESDMNMWMAYPVDSFVRDNKVHLEGTTTPEEAVARLGIALHRPPRATGYSDDW